MAKIGPVYPEIFDQIHKFLAVSYQTFTHELCQLWSYWTEFDIEGIIYAVNAHIEVAISHSVSECQCDESGEFAIFLSNWFPSCHGIANMTSY